MIRRLCQLLLWCLIWLLVPITARAQVERFAVIVGNNRGHASDGALAYAESDAAKMYAVLRELGSFPPLNMALLQGEDASTVRSTLIAINDRIRNTQERGSDSILFVYYSGHADAEALHLGDSHLRMAELAQLVRGSSATIRLLVADACRSGALTRVKGGKPLPPFALPTDARLPGEGLAFLTASAAGEDAHESDEIRGSFFTHALVSGLLGAADRNGDGQVVLEEAYRYAYDTTLRATSRTFQGVQHPSFHIDLRGRDSVVLTHLKQSPRRGALTLPAGIGFLVLRDDAHGTVIAEVLSGASARTLSLAHGTYFLRGRAPEFLLEGRISIQEGEHHNPDLSSFDHIKYARLSRKGGTSNVFAHSLDVGALLHSQSEGSDSPCVGATAGYMLDAPRLSLSIRAGACRSTRQSTFVRTINREYDLSAALLYPWDLPIVTLSAGFGAGLTLVSQQFETRGHAPPRTVAQPFVQLLGVATIELTTRFFVRLDGRAETHFVRLEERRNVSTVASFVVRGALSIGAYIR